MMRPLIIDEEIRKKIQVVIGYAKENIFSRSDLKAIVAGKARPPGDRLGFRMDIPVHYTVVYTEEQQSDDLHLKHISISVPSAGKLPNKEAVKEILKEFGFTHGIDPPNHVYLEQDERAINIMEKITS